MSNPTWSQDFLDSMREQCDPPADEAVRLLFEREKITAANALMKQLVINENVSVEMLAPPLRDYFQRSGQLPSWTDMTLVHQGEELFSRYGPHIITALFCASLPSCYAAAKGVQVLHLTARLETDPYRRIMETAQMIVDVMAPGGLVQGGRGVRSAQKVRLMHAAVRHLIRRSGHWNFAWGQPINQEDMAGTLLSFSTVVLQSLEKMGCVLSDTERQAYYHAWRVVGYVMGIDERLLPEHVTEGFRFQELIQRRVYGPTPEGRTLTQALLEMMEHSLPGNVFDNMPATLTRYLIGDSAADLLAVPPSNWTRALLGPLKVLGWVSDDVVNLQGPQASKLIGLVSRKLLDGLLWVNRGPDRVPFRLPTTLRESWNVQGWERA
ncbi:oxygenase MpaB family protein [Hyalangium versicolor]|uniref:oxygenase MpaB family protein n=1 Tax=Hyalangium versicolor TaxID=2861190 RepID=UPI001CCC40AA|nr:oxygenase MpaB family protein [Hyalangium versicolor]